MNGKAWTLLHRFSVLILACWLGYTGCGNDRKNTPEARTSAELQQLVAASDSAPDCSQLRFRLEKNTTKSAMLEIGYQTKNALVDLNPLIRLLELEEGELEILPRKTEAGCPILKYICYCETDEMNRDIPTEMICRDRFLVLSLRDTNGKMVWASPPLRELGAFSCETPPQRENDVAPISTDLNGSILSISSNSKCLRTDLSDVLSGGTWHLDKTASLPGYDGVLLWNCITRPHSEEYCYCDSSRGEDFLRDNPTCWNYKRTARLAFRLSQRSDSLLLKIFEQNFVSPAFPDSGSEFAARFEVH